MAASLERVRICEAELRAEAAALISPEQQFKEVQNTSKKQCHKEGKRPDLQLYQPGAAQACRGRDDTGEETLAACIEPDPRMHCSSVSDQMPDHHLDCIYKEQSSDHQLTEGTASKDSKLSAGSPRSQKTRRMRKPDREIYQPGGRRSQRETVQNKQTDQEAKAEETVFERGGIVEHGGGMSLKRAEKKEEKEKERTGKRGWRNKQTAGKPKNVDSNETGVEKITKGTEQLNIRAEGPRNNLEGVDGSRGEGGKEKKEKRKWRNSTQPEQKEWLQSEKVNNAVHPLKKNGEQIKGCKTERDASGKNFNHDQNLQKAGGRRACVEDSNKETHKAFWETEPRKESAVTKRYSKSDIRRPRNRNYSTSSASSANSVDGQGESKSLPKAFGGQETVEREVALNPYETGGGKKNWSRVEQPRRWRDTSTTDSLEENETWEGACEREVPKNKAEKKNRSTVRSKGTTRGGKGPTFNRPGGFLKVDRPSETTSGAVEKLKDQAELREQGRSSCGRGILVLPAHTELTTSAENMPRPAYGVRSGTGHGRERSGRGGSTRRLWDPNNPDKKPALTKNQQSQHSAHLQPLYLQHQGGYPPLHFLDTDDETSPVSQNQYCYAMPNYKYQNSENPYGYPLPSTSSSTPPQYPYSGQFHYQIAGSNGMYPSAGMAPLYEAFGRGRHGYHSAGTTNIAPEDTELLTRGELSKLLRRADSQEVQLGNLLSRERLSQEGLEKMAQLRTELLTSYERVILTDIEFSDSQNVDQLLWKNVFYQVIERFRQFLKDHDVDAAAQIRAMLLTLLDEGAVFFDSLLQSLQNTFQFTLEDYMDGMAIRSKPLKKTVKYALKSAQRCMICQGDIARYREQASNSANYGKARSWYLKAQQIAPKNGRPYNQLALLAVYTKRKLDAVYYYMRSLAASNPILTAKESLMSLFEEAKRKAEQMERRQKQDKAAPCGPPGQRISSGDHDSIRVEIWISPTRHPGVTSHTTGSKYDKCAGQNEGLDSLSASDLNKRFILSFLHTHGKLFTKVGMENFSAVASCMLQEFRCILQHSPCPLGNTRMLQIITINMFTIYYAQDRAKGQGDARSVLEEQSTFVGLAMFGLLVQRCTELLEGMPTEPIQKESDKCDDDVEPMVPVSSFQADLHELLPSVKVWSDWMLGHPEQWNPPPSNLDGGPDVWQCLADLCNSLARVYHGEAPLYKADADGEGDEELHLLVLEEDRMLAGFVPLLAAPQEPCYIEYQTDPTIAADCKRVTVLKYFLEALCGQEEPLLAFKDGKYVSIAMLPNPCHSAVNKSQSEVHRQSQEDHMLGGETSVFPSEGAVDGDGNEDDLSELRARRSALAQELAQQQKRRDKIQAVLQNRCQMELEIRPFYLVPDTNAFIDHLEGLKKLLACGTYVLVVPLIVITELDGLAKGKCAQHEEYVNRAGHARLVQEHAKAAVAFLEKGFEAREPGLRALTSRGSQLESIAFRSEDTSGHQGNNDDVILSCCLHYCEDKAKDFMPAHRDAPVRLFREVVLLTDDRNLRVKALTRNVPVRDIPAFLSWAKVG